MADASPPVVKAKDPNRDIVEICTECSRCGNLFRRDVPGIAWDTRTIINCESCQPSLGMH